jgi:hypothetical protein
MRNTLAAAMVAYALGRTCAAAAPQYFGFSWLHSTSAATIPYPFTNIDVRPVSVSDPAAQAWADSRSLYESYGVSSVLGFNDFLFGDNNTSAVTRPDAVQLFDTWWDSEANRSTVRPPWVVAIWPADSALLRCGGAPDIAGCLEPYLAFVSHIRDRTGGTGVILIDTFDSVSVATGLLMQEAGDLAGAGIRWFGYNQYGVLHPLADATYQANVRRVREIAEGLDAQGYGTRFFLVGDAFHASPHVKLVDGVVVPWDWSDHRTVVDEDFQIACRNDAVALILFNWPSYSWLGEQNVLGSESFQDPAACWETCVGRFVKFGESTCTLCGGVPMPVTFRYPLRPRRRLTRP